MKKRMDKFVLFFILCVTLSLSATGARADWSRWVDPFIGTAKGGNTFPGAVVPWGMVSVSPHNNLAGPSGYVYGDPDIYGFGQVHLSGVNCPDLGSVLITPTTGALQTQLEKIKSPYDSEESTPGYYRVHLKDSDVVAEMTASTRVGMIQFLFPAQKRDANILINVSHRLTTDPTGTRTGFESKVKILSNSEIEGFSQSGDFCTPYSGNKQTVYFVARFSKAAQQVGTWKGTRVQDNNEQSGKNGEELGAFLKFSTAEKEAVIVKVGISYVSIENARLNLQTEVPGWDFQGARAAAHLAWEKELSKFQVIGGTPEQNHVFYTALYHTLLEPSIFDDINGEYQGMGHSGVRKAEGYTRYSMFSLWDTYRTLHPFLSLFYPGRELDMVKSLVEMGKESGWTPRWELAGNDTGVMVADPAVPVILDGYRQGFRNFDVSAAYDSIVKSLTPANDNKMFGGIKSLPKYGYIPRDDDSKDRIWGSVTTTMDYAYDYWCLAQLARDLHHDGDYEKYIHLAGAYRNLYDPVSGFFRPKKRDGSWVEPFDPSATCCDQDWPNSGGPGFVEGNAWQYLFHAPQDRDGLRMLMGGDEAFVKKLQDCFDGNHYDATNEPDLSWAYLFDDVPKAAWRTQKQVREIMKTSYGTGPDGLPGNDDTGTLSAWYLFSALGFYPVCPGSNVYQIGSPLFKQVDIRLDKETYPGGVLALKTINNSDRNPYIRSILIDGVEFKKTYLDQKTLVFGKSIVFKMGGEPQK